MWYTTREPSTETTYAKLINCKLYDNFVTGSGTGWKAFNHYKFEWCAFYGGGETKAKYKDAYVENNFMWHIRLFVHLAVPVNTRDGLGFNWRNNVIVKPYGSEFSSLGSDPENAKGNF